MNYSDSISASTAKSKLQYLLKQKSKELLMVHYVNQGIKFFLKSLRYHKHLPKWLWLRLPAIGDFSINLPNGKILHYHSLGEFTGRVLYWRGVQGFESGFTSLFFALATSANVFVDIGAHVGLYTLLAKATNPSLRVIAFEPIPHIYAQLKQNIILNQLTNTVAVEQMVISKSNSCSVPFFVSDDASTSSLYHEFVNSYVTSTQISLPAYKLDDYVKHHCHETVDLIKIDVEGAEVDVLEGSQDILLHHKPIIFCEILPKNKDAFAQIQSILGLLSYEYGSITSEGVLQVEELVPHENYHNYLFWPKGKRNLLDSRFLNMPAHHLIQN